MIKTIRHNIVFNLYITIILIGFFVIGSIPVLISNNIKSLSEYYRFVILFFSLILSLYLIKLKNKNNNYNLFLFYLFWIIYSFRILYDLLLGNVILTGDYSKTFYIQYAFGVILIPSYCVILINRTIILDYKRILKIVFNILFITLLFTEIKRFSNIEIIDRSSQIINIGIIEFGHYGCTLVLLSVYRIIEEKMSPLKLLILIIAIIVGISAITISASKGPLLALMISLLFYFTFRFKLKSLIFIQTLLILIFYFYGFYILEIISDFFDSNFLSRIIHTIDEGKDEARNGLLKAALDDFSNSPILGNSMFIQKNGFAGSYPHNLVVESFMATGIIGGSIFVFLVLNTLIKAIKLIINKLDYSWISLIFFQYFIFGMVSSNLYSLDQFWISLGIILATYNSTKNEHIN